MSLEKHAGAWVRENNPEKFKVTNSLNPYGPRFYYLHRDNILAQLKVMQEQRGVLNPSHINQFCLRYIDGKNVLLAQQGRLARL